MTDHVSIAFLAAGVMMMVVVAQDPQGRMHRQDPVEPGGRATTRHGVRGPLQRGPLARAIGYVAPADKLAGRDRAILAERDRKLDAARRRRKAARAASRPAG